MTHEAAIDHRLNEILRLIAHGFATGDERRELQHLIADRRRRMCRWR